jgi:hypothetical protein
VKEHRKNIFGIKLMKSTNHIIVFILVLVIVAGGIFFLNKNDYFTKTSVDVTPWYTATNEKGDAIFAVFNNRLPCSDCTTTKFEIVFYRDNKTQAPTTYKMRRVYVGVESIRSVNDDIVIDTDGTWTITQGTPIYPQVKVYQLDANSPEEFRLYMALSDDVVFILDNERYPLIGDGFYSYSLNKK